MPDFSTAVLTFIGGVGFTGFVLWLMKKWLSERLSQSISHEYSQKLESYKNELNSRLETIKHENEVNKLRTSLFFDHQRSAFAEILSKIVETNKAWVEEEWTEYAGIAGPVPSPKYRELQDIYLKHQLFLDNESIMAMNLLLDVYSDSFPFFDGSEPRKRDVQGPYETVELLMPLIAAIFQQKIGITADSTAARQVALLGSIRALNNHHFPDIKLPVKGALSTKKLDGGSSQAIINAETNFPELLKKLKEFDNYLQTKMFHFHEAKVTIGRYLRFFES